MTVAIYFLGAGTNLGNLVWVIMMIHAHLVKLSYLTIGKYAIWPVVGGILWW
jgi:hypothetical protein